MAAREWQDEALLSLFQRQERIQEQLLEAHARLEQHDDAVGSGEAISKEMPVGLSQRAFPLLDMLKAAEKKGVPIVWGV